MNNYSHTLSASSERLRTSLQYIRGMFARYFLKVTPNQLRKDVPRQIRSIPVPRLRAVLSSFSFLMLCLGTVQAQAQDFGVTNFATTPTIFGVGAPGNITVNVVRASGSGSVVVTVPLGTLLELNTLPAGCTVAPAAPPNQVLSCTVNPATNLVEETLTIPVRGFAIGAVGINISVPADTNAGNNNALGTITVQAGGDLRVNKVAHLSSAAPPASWSGTENIPSASLVTYTLRPEIFGSAPQNNFPAGQTITVTDTLPSAASFQFLNTTGSAPWTCLQSGLTVTCTLAGPRSAGPLPVIIINGRLVAPVTGTIDNQAAITTTAGYTDSNGANNTQNQSGTPVRINITPGADLRATVGLFSPSPVSNRLATTDAPVVRITGINNGFFDAPGAVVRTAIPAGFTIGVLPAGCVNSGAGTVNAVSGTVVTCTAASLNSGGNVFFEIPISKADTATPALAVVFPVEVVPPVAVPDTNLANNVNATTLDWVLPFADLTLTKAAIAGPVVNGSPYPVSISASNSGASTATFGAAGSPSAFVVTDSVRNDVTAINSILAGWSCTLGAADSAAAGRKLITCERTAAGTLAVSAAFLLTFNLTASGGVVELDNTACTGSTALSALGRDPVTAGPQPPDPGVGPEANDCASSGGGVFTTNISAPVAAIKDVINPATGLFVAADVAGDAPTIRASAANFDNTITYRLRGTNNSATNAIDTLVISDNVANIFLDSASGGPTGINAIVTNGTGSCVVTGSAIRCEFPTLAIAATAEVTVTLTRPFRTGTGLQNEVVLSSPRTTITETTPGSSRNRAFVNVEGVSDIRVNSKVVSPNPVAVGQLATFVIELVNRGPNEAAGVTVVDDFNDTNYTIIGTPTIGGGSCTTTPNTPAAGFTRVLCTRAGTLARNATTTVNIQVRPRLRVGVPPYNNETNLAIANTTTCERTTASAACDDGTLGNLSGTLSKDNNAQQATFNITAVNVDVFNAKNNVGGAIFGFGNQVSYLLRMQNGGSGTSRAETMRMIDVLSPAAGYTMTLASLTGVNAAAANPATPTLVNRTPVCTQRTGVAGDICGVSAAGLQVVECRIGGASFNDPLNFLDPGQETNFVLNFNVDSTPIAGVPPIGPQSVSNTATICVDPSYATDIAPGNNTASANSTMLALTDLALTKTTVTAQPADINQPIQYNLVLRNNGPAGTPQMRVSDVLPPNFEFFATGPNAPTVSVGSFVSGSGLTAQTVTCTATPPAPITIGQQQTVSCIVNATAGTSLFPGSSDVNNTVTVSIRARAVENLFTTPYLTNLANNATVSPGRDVSNNDISLDQVAGNNTATSNSQIQNASIRGRVFRDRNNNGTQDGTAAGQDEGIGLVTVTLTGTDLYGNPINRVVTTLDTVGVTRGDYLFGNLPPSNASGYTIVETQPTAFVNGINTVGIGQGGTVGAPTNAGQLSSTFPALVLTGGATGTGFNFAEIPPAMISGFVYEDRNNNGQRDLGEPGIAGVSMQLTGNDSLGNPQTPPNVITDANGFYTFTVPPSSVAGYTVRQVGQPAGFFDGKDILGQIAAGSPPSGNIVSNSSNGAGAANYTAAGVTPGTPAPNPAGTNDTVTGIVVSGEEHHDNNFGEIRPAQISGTVYLDANGNGLREPAETTGIPNITVTINGTDLNGNAVNRSVNTDASGNYSFAGLLPGTYVVTEGPVVAYTHTGAATQGANAMGIDFLNRVGNTTTTVAVGTPTGTVVNPAVSAINIGSGGNSQGNNFGERASVISGRVCIDNGTGGGTSNNGRCEAGETGIAGVTVTLTGTATDGSIINIQVVTSATGAYSFPELKLPNAAGYTITETQPATFADGRQVAGTLTPFAGVDPSAVIGATTNVVGNDAITGIRFTTATNASGYDFGEFRASSISGFVYADANGNSTRDMTDPPLVGVVVTLFGTDIDGNVINIPTMTDVNGRYTFPNLRPGSYRVVETQPVFASQGANNIGTGVAGAVTNTPLDTFNITLAENENAINFNFGELTTSISGSVYEDLNGNGIRDAGEPGIAGVPIQLTGTDINLVAVTRNVVTDANGNYSFVGLIASNPAGYVIRELTQPAGFFDGRESIGTIGGTPRGNANTNDQFAAVVLGAADTGINYNFGEVRPASITGGVYVDVNNDGVRDANDTPISGVLITLTGTDFNGAPVNRTVNTDAQGNYAFTGLAPGNYTVTETQPNGFGEGATTAGTAGGTAATNSVASISLSSGQNAVGYNFGERLFGLSGNVYEDKNNDGLQGADEPGIPNTTITLTGRDINGNPINLVVVTDTQGKYVFANLPPSDAAGYTITETQPPGFNEGRATAGNGGGSVNPNGNVIGGVLVGGTNPSGLVNYNFGEIKPASIAGSVYDDRNNSGVRDAGEPPIAGVTITLTGTDDRGAAVSLTAITDATGNYTFGNLRPGTYALVETQPMNFSDGRETIGSLGGTNGTNDRIDAITVRSGDTGISYNFGELSGGISGQVYVDVNNNGVRDPGEEPIASVTITLTGVDTNGVTVTRTAITDTNGQYQIIGLPPSNAAGYTITQTQPPAYADGITRAGGAGGTVTPNRVSNIVFPGGSIVPGYDFGERGASIGGTVYVDTNDNGTRDANELPIAGVTVTLTGVDINGLTVTRTITTLADGSYRFEGLALPGPAGYSITETQPVGFLDGRESIGSLGGTTTNDNFNVRFTAPGANGTGYNFGERIQSPGAITGQVYLDSNGDRANNDGPNSGQTNWIVELTIIGPDGRAIVIATTRTDANGNYRFDNLPPGNYSVVFRNPSNNITAGRLQNIVVTMGATVIRQDFPIDPSGVIFDNCTGRPIAGARVFIAGPAGFDPNIHLTDPQMQGQVVGADGFYQIFLTPNAPGGVYTLSVIPPPGYTTTGQTAPQTTILNATTCPIDPSPGTPCLVNPTARPVISGVCPNPNNPIQTPLLGPTFFNQILIVTGGTPGPQDVLNNHIGLTALPVGNQIVLRKSAARLNVVRGELIPYTITATNVSMTTLNNTFVIDSMPPGFRYVPNSARISGPATSASTTPPTTPISPLVNGVDLAFPIARFAPRDVFTISLLLSPNVGVSEGEYVNSALVRTDIRGGALSNLAQATVKIVADPLFDCTDIIGKVYDDRNKNGMQDEGEPGLKGVRIVSARGISATTDSEGRYHVACAAIPQQDLGSNFVLKLDERSLPSGYRTTTDNPLVERLTRGKLVKMNFGATIHRVVRLDINEAAFEAGKADLKPEFASRIDEVINALQDSPSILRVGYLVGADTSTSLIDGRVKAVKQQVAERWSKARKKPKSKDNNENIAQYPLDIEVEVVRDPAALQGTVNSSNVGGVK